MSYAPAQGSRSPEPPRQAANYEKPSRAKWQSSRDVWQPPGSAVRDG
jgi:hypothetical protein